MSHLIANTGASVGINYRVIDINLIGVQSAVKTAKGGGGWGGESEVGNRGQEGEKFAALWASFAHHKVISYIFGHQPSSLLGGA